MTWVVAIIITLWALGVAAIIGYVLFAELPLIEDYPDPEDGADDWGWGFPNWGDPRR